MLFAVLPKRSGANTFPLLEQFRYPSNPINKLTLVQAGIALLADHPPDGGEHAFPLVAMSSHVHLALDGDVRVCGGCGKAMLTLLKG